MKAHNLKIWLISKVLLDTRLAVLKAVVFQSQPILRLQLLIYPNHFLNTNI